MDRTINIKIKGSHFTKDNRSAGVQYEANAKRLRIEFDGGWTGYAKTVTFWNAKGLNPVKRILTVDLCEDIAATHQIYALYIPGEAMTEAGMLTFVIDGYVDGARQRSLSGALEVEPAPRADDAAEAADPIPTKAEQLQAQIDGIIETIHTSAVAASTADNAAKTAKESETKAAASEKAATESKDSAEKAQRAIENMTVSGNNVPADSNAAVVEKTVDQNGAVNLHFNVRQGVSGVYVGSGDMPEGYNVQIDPNGDATSLEELRDALKAIWDA